MGKFTLLKTEGKARRARFETVHGVIETPVFMNVGTSAAIKGGISTRDLEDVGCQVELSNTYHLHIRPGDELIRRMGGLHKFFNWQRPVLTDSGGFQVFSLAKLIEFYQHGTPNDDKEIIDFIKTHTVREILANEAFFGQDISFLTEEVEACR